LSAKTVRRVIAASAWLALAAAPALAQAPPAPPADAADAPAADDGKVSELVVVAHPLGPAVWRVQVGQSSMVILGSVTPVQQQQHWDQRQVAAALDGARLLLTPPKPDLGPVQVVGLITTNLWKVRQGKPVESLMPPDLRARFVAARTHAYQKEDRYAHWKPAVAGFLLLSDYRRSYGFSEGKPATTVEKMAKGMHVPAQPIGAVRVGLLMKVASRLDDRQNLECLSDTLNQMEYEGAHAPDLNDDWARGNVLSINARYRVSALQRCLMRAPGANAVIDDEMNKAADRLWSELQKPGKTVAVIDMAWLLPQGGLLDRLKAKGAVVGPPPALAADAPAAAEVN
jgi:hypothetical protein